MNNKGENNDSCLNTRRYYSDVLLDEYKASRGFAFVNLNSPFIIEDIERFITARKRSNDLYARLLDGLSIEHRDSDTLENISAREFLISSTCDYDTTVVSSDKRIYDDIRSDRIIPGNIRVYDGIPVIFRKNSDGYYSRMDLDRKGFKTIMRTNPKPSSIKFFDKLYRLGKYNLIIGVNGNSFDYDYNEKIKTIEDFSQNKDLLRYITFDHETYDYAYLLASPSLRRIK